ncbi:MAG: hypothetical protein L0215_14440 [Gemmataceae bacterium]|nr:hypothetical protein [Gemmataceae bacterium]
MSKNCHAALAAAVLAWALDGSAPAQSQPTEPPDQAGPAKEKVHEAVRQQLDRWRKGNEVLNELRQKEVEIWQKELLDDVNKRHPVERFRREMIKREALDQLYWAIMWLVLAAFFGIYGVVQMRKLFKRPAQEPRVCRDVDAGSTPPRHAKRQPMPIQEETVGSVKNPG